MTRSEKHIKHIICTFPLISLHYMAINRGKKIKEIVSSENLPQINDHIIPI